MCHIFHSVGFHFININFHNFITILYKTKYLFAQKFALSLPAKTQAMFPFGHETVSIWKLFVLTGSRFGSFIKTSKSFQRVLKFLLPDAGIDSFADTGYTSFETV